MSGPNIACPPTCSTRYSVGTVVALTARPKPGWAFAGWGPPCTNTGSCSIRLDSDQTVSATFVRPRTSNLIISPKAFKALARGQSANATGPGALVRFTLNLTSLVRFKVRGLFSGRMQGSFTWPGKPGVNRFRFTGRLNGHRLSPGRYQLLAEPIVAGHARQAASTTFEITS